MDTDLMEDIVVHGKLKAPSGERSADNRCSCKVQLQELSRGEDRARTDRPEEDRKHLVILVVYVAGNPPIDLVEEVVAMLLDLIGMSKQ